MTRTRDPQRRPVPAPGGVLTSSAPSAVSTVVALERALDEVGLAEELGQLGVPGGSIQRRRRVDLGDDPAAQDGHLVGHRERLVLVVGHQDRGGTREPQHVVDIGADRGAERGVEGREGLIEEDDLGLRGQGAGQGDALLLPTGELMGVAAGQAGQADQFEQLVHPAAAPILAGQPEGHVAPDVEVREERTFLGHIPDPPLLARDEPLGRVVDHFSDPGGPHRRRAARSRR